MRLPSWLKQALSGPERIERYTSREICKSGIVAYYWDGGAPKKHAVKDISSGGAYLYANEPWCVGTIITVTFQKEAEGEGAATTFAVLNCRVVRHTPDGAEIEFMLRTEEERKALKQFMRKVGESGADRGQALVEFMAVIPMLFLLIALAFNFGTWLYGWVAVGNAARAAGNYAILSGSSAGLPPTATASGLQGLVTTDLTHLPYQSSTNPAVCVEKKNNGAPTTLMESPSGACATANSTYGAPWGDTEAKAAGSTLTYPNVTIDVTYSYTPFFLGSNILGLPLTILPTTIHRRTVMRIL